MKTMSTNIIPLSRPDINRGDISEVARVLKTGMLVQGIEVQKLEKAISGFLLAGNCSAVSSGTAALHLALLALGIKPGDEVIVPALSFIATANVVELVGARCVFVDTHPIFYNIDESLIEKAITKNTKAIIPVHEFGLCANMHEILNISERYKLKVIEDAACALGAKCKNKYAGTFGHFGAFSLHPRKAITSGEGGLLITVDNELDRKIKTLRNHGIDPDSSPINFIMAGFNYRMTDFQASLVLSQFSRFNKILEYRTRLAEIYLNEIKHPGVRLPKSSPDNVHTWQTFHLLLESESERNKLMALLKSKGVLTNYGAQCIPAMQYYKKKYKHEAENEFPNAYKTYKCGLAIPLYDKLKEKQVLFISRIINRYK
ncbi:MAG: DegT/DnrJ/EryC1/StrS family aminotransferase [Bacteroidales bacterium]|nr:DegT/DnrJ/EryC1/StrS family aminotransferase [Bacteroidales bacterium]